MKAQLFPVVVAALAAAAAGASAITPDMLQRFIREEGAYNKSVVIDITREFERGMPIDSSHPGGLGQFFVSRSSIKEGQMANTINFTLNNHWGTHLDAPGYFNQTLLDEGYDVDSLNIDSLSDPCWVVDTPRDKNITAEVMEELNIGRGVESHLQNSQHRQKVDESISCRTLFICLIDKTL